MSFHGDWNTFHHHKVWIATGFTNTWNTYFGNRGINISIDVIDDNDDDADIVIGLDPSTAGAEATSFGQGFGVIFFNPGYIAEQQIDWLFWAGAHEMGHIVGLGNSECLGSLMMRFFSDNLELSCSDINTLNFMYRGDESPLLIDLSGDGIRLSSAPHGVPFDIRADGTSVRTAWPLSGDDAFLVLDANGNGVIDDSAEMFGNHTPMADGTTALHAYEALAALDDNQDGVIDRADAVFSRLRLWSDALRDGISQAGEIRTLAEARVARISLKCWDPEFIDLWGNWYALASFVRKTSQPSVVIAVDVFLTTDDR